MIHRASFFPAALAPHRAREDTPSGKFLQKILAFNKRWRAALGWGPGVYLLISQETSMTVWPSREHPHSPRVVHIGALKEMRERNRHLVT